MDIRKKLDCRHTCNGKQLHRSRIVPGYTGHIPSRNNHEFGRSYSEECDSSMSRHDDWQQSVDSVREVLLSASRRQPTLQVKSPNLTQFKSKNQVECPPINLLGTKDERNVVPGYAGHIPRQMKQIGLTYPMSTERALDEFLKDRTKNRKLLHKEMKLKDILTRNKPAKRDGKDIVIPPIYQENEGMIVGYSGHVPGKTFRHGHTFGNVTKDPFERKHSDEETCYLTGERLTNMDSRVIPPNCCTTVSQDKQTANI